MKRVFALLIALEMLISLWPQAVLAQDTPAAGTVIPFTAIEISCSETPGTETTEGDITRHRGQIEPVVWFSEEPLARGRLEEVIDWNYYASIDQGDYTGTLVFSPADGSGTMEGSFSGYWTGDAGSFLGYASGSGELNGLEMTMTGAPMAAEVALALIADDPRVVDGNPCYPDPMPEVGEAVVIYGFFVDRRPEPMDSDIVDEIAAVNEQFKATFAAGDAEGMAEFYTDDGQLMPPNADFVTGKDAIQAFWQSLMDSGVTGVRLEIIEAVAMGDMAYEVSTYTTYAGDEQVADEGKYIVIWKQVDGEWKLYRDIFNSNLPE